jgi:hypothetical protein
MLTYPDGSTYKGNWVNNLPSGIGTARKPDGSTYKGSWWAGKFDGRGVLTLADGTRKEGLWKEGKLSKSEKSVTTSKESLGGSGWKY